MTSTVYRCVVPGQPQPKQRARVYVTRQGKVRAVTPERTRNAELALAWALKLAWRQEPDAKSLFGVRCRFVFSRTRKGADRRVDGDNCLKAVLDAGNGVVWQDDSQVRKHEVDVDFGADPRTEISFWVLV
jgi:Holliday junction resolvase RusA-like endonuclease